MINQFAWHRFKLQIGVYIGRGQRRGMSPTLFSILQCLFIYWSWLSLQIKLVFVDSLVFIDEKTTFTDSNELLIFAGYN